ncbi:UMF1 family MFS transporter [Enterococcus sp. PF1-24]|uniref:MFS transporter n=1 Tax=unclassified Enterococcus TaxID=2608891 RepID=UPI002475EDD6|nr:MULTISPECIES: MFS transporter [unclassified Enterococcus]MDH6364178.1 UMF1 family MFS transporter [Enterococcus sp. PFB1-1]MDH6401279.1 UMF1 family MFS transporter [Enterococcus sp. PF1-24]
MLKFWKSYTKEERGWILYDWANSAYSLVVVTAILPIYFKFVAGEAGISNGDSTAYWGYASSFATLLISLSAPILGTLGDYEGKKKKLFNLFALSGIIMTFVLAFVPNKSWVALLVIYAISHMGYQGANIFYDGFLVDVTDDERMDNVSSMGYGLGYIGSALLFIAVMILQVTDGFGLLDTILVTKICFILTGLWWLLFSLPFFRHVHQKFSLEAIDNPVKVSFQRLKGTIENIRQYKGIVFFLIAYFFYIDGVDTIFTMATAFGIDMGVSSDKLIIILLVINFIAFPFTILYGLGAKRFGTKKMILLAIAVYTFICIYALFMDSVLDFWIVGILVGTSQGGIQALSRSYFAQMIPKEHANEFFGFYNIFGKFSAILGPMLFGFMTSLTGNSRYGIASLILLFIIGAILFAKTPTIQKDSAI